jgi:DNA repair exonuclease SbcCD nuclease subunit
MKFVHAADIHLDSPLRGLARYEGAPVERVRGATRRALENLVELCLREGAAFLLLAGDLYDGSWKDYSTGLFFAAQMARLRAGGVRVFLVRGNHDAASKITLGLRWPENVRELSVRKPETVVLEDLGVAIHGQGFATKAVTDDLAAVYPSRVDGAFNVGLLHTSVTGREGHESYAPCKVETLVGKGYDYWALGHVHQREVLSELPWIVFPGNLQGRHARETGEKGASLVTLEGARILSVEHRALDVVRWRACTIDVTEAAEAADVVDLVREALERESLACDGRALAARVTLAGATRAHAALRADEERWANEIRMAANDVGEEVWVEKVLVGTRSTLDLDALAKQDDVVGQVVRSLRALRDDRAALEELTSSLADLRAKLPVELREAGLALDDPEAVAATLADVEQLILPRLLAREEDG